MARKERDNLSYMADLTTEQVWQELEKNLFAVIGMVSARNEARTAGVVYVVRDHMLYIGTGKDSWKARHIAQNPHVSVTVAIPKQIPLMPWFKIPAATITFSGIAAVYPLVEMDADLQQAIFRGMQTDAEMAASSCMIEIEPVKDFITYGVGVSLMGMRDTQQARGRVPVALDSGV
jgi:hypothetical protein